MRFLLRFPALLALACTFATDARAGIVTFDPFSESGSSAFGNAVPFDPATGGPLGVIDESQNDTGLNSAATGFSFDNGLGFTGSVSNSISLSKTLTPSTLQVMISGASSAVAANTSPDAFSSSSAGGFSDSSIVFHTNSPGVAVLTLNVSLDPGVVNSGHPFGDQASTQTDFLIFGFSDNRIAQLEYQTGSFPGGSNTTLFGFSTTNPWGGGNSIALTLTPGDYVIFGRFSSGLQFTGPGSVTDPFSNGVGTAEVAVPAPSTFTMSTIMFGVFGGMWSYRRLKRPAPVG